MSEKKPSECLARWNGDAKEKLTGIILDEHHTRLTALEAENKDLRTDLEASKVHLFVQREINKSATAWMNELEAIVRVLCWDGCLSNNQVIAKAAKDYLDSHPAEPEKPKKASFVAHVIEHPDSPPHAPLSGWIEHPTAEAEKPKAEPCPEWRKHIEVGQRSERSWWVRWTDDAGIYWFYHPNGGWVMDAGPKNSDLPSFNTRGDAYHARETCPPPPRVPSVATAPTTPREDGLEEEAGKHYNAHFAHQSTPRMMADFAREQVKKYKALIEPKPTGTSCDLCKGTIWSNQGRVQGGCGAPWQHNTCHLIARAEKAERELAAKSQEVEILSKALADMTAKR